MQNFARFAFIAHNFAHARGYMKKGYKKSACHDMEEREMI